jgi:MYXO-CTERM domain-containing protein
LQRCEDNERLVWLREALWPHGDGVIASPTISQQKVRSIHLASVYRPEYLFVGIGPLISRRGLFRAVAIRCSTSAANGAAQQQKGVLPLLALALFAFGRKRDELLDISDGQVAGITKQSARPLQLKARRQQQIIDFTSRGL